MVHILIEKNELYKQSAALDHSYSNFKTLLTSKIKVSVLTKESK